MGWGMPYGGYWRSSLLENAERLSDELAQDESDMQDPMGKGKGKGKFGGKGKGKGGGEDDDIPGSLSQDDMKIKGKGKGKGKGKKGHGRKGGPKGSPGDDGVSRDGSIDNAMN